MMRFKTLFRSRIERQIAIPLIFALTLPVLGVSMVAMEVIRQSAIHDVEARLQSSAKDYGMLLLERINVEFEDELAAFESTKGNASARPSLHIDEANNLILGTDDKYTGVPLSLLTQDVHEISDVKRCVSVNDHNACFVDSDHELARTWHLRLISQFDSTDEIAVTISHNRQLALKNTGLITRLLPFVIALIAALVGYGTVLYLRRRFKPVPRLRNAIKEIEQGHFGKKIQIDTNDEFALLGDALNSLSDELHTTFGFREIVSQIDEKILAGVPPMRIFSDICLAACTFAGVGKACVVVPPGVDEHNVVGFSDGAEYVGKNASAHDVLTGPPSIEGFEDCVSLPISSEQTAWGWLFVSDNNLADKHRLEELVRKASVAATSFNRSNLLFNQATYDGLTGLLNRAAFVHELERMVAQNHRNGEIGALIFLDLDQFKRINDTDGHTVGDQLLRIVGERLKTCVRESDLVARLGGDEFAIGLPSIEDNHALIALLRRILDTISIPMQVGKFEHSMCCSMGVCLLPQDGSNTEEILKNADLAMYKAKAEPGSTFAYFDPSLNEQAERRVLLEGKLRDVIEGNGLNIHLQPKVNLLTSKADTFEALVRWTDADLGIVLPSEFVDVAERSGLIESLTDAVIVKVAKLITDYPAEIIQRVAINLSPAQLAAPGFAHKFLNTLRKNDCDFNRIEVEVTESIFVDNPDAAKEKLLVLKDHGIKISLDDFGTGFSSLSLIMHLPLDALKIDKSFVDNLVFDKPTAIVVSKIIEMATSLGIEVIAEGVENHLQIELLKKMGATHLQGFVISKPLPLDALTAFLDSETSGPRAVSL
jgi:diguanylate cyclase (GGDEF)-like protein